VTPVLVPDPLERPAASPAGPAHGIAVPPPVALGTRLELLRSLERMEADLAELRAEVERMRGQLRERQLESARRRS
jgi:hypothetical protein